MRDLRLGPGSEDKKLLQRIILGKLAQYGITLNFLNLITVQWLCKRMPFVSTKRYTEVFRGKGAWCLQLTLKWFQKKIFIHAQINTEINTHMHTYIHIKK